MKSVDKQCRTDDGQTAGGQQTDRQTNHGQRGQDYDGQTTGGQQADGLTTVNADKTTMDRPPTDS